MAHCFAECLLASSHVTRSPNHLDGGLPLDFGVKLALKR
jgi:hypothetical protein